ncbi:TIGR02996 domain-containing protein [Pyxidicoccus sp. 3LG]
MLERAADAFLSHNEEEALAHLLDVWERTRATRLAELITQLSTRLTARFTPPESSPWRRASTRYKTTDLPRRIERFRGAADDRRPRRLDEAADSHCDALERALSEREATEARLGPTLEALFAQVYENPDDDSPRLVLADALMELGEPRGRCMMLELRGEHELARACDWNVAQWLFPLGPYGDPPLWSSFERGFPAVISPDFPRDEPLVPPGPAWATVREIALDGCYRDSPRQLADWLMHPNLRRVEALQKVVPWLARELCTRPLPVKRLELVIPGGEDGLGTQEPGFFTHLASLPHLARVDIRAASPEDVSLCANSPLAPRLERFTAEGDMGWSLVAAPSGEVTVEAWLRNRDGVYGLAPALRGAARFGTRALRIHLAANLDPEEREMLTEAAALYARVEWD